MERVFLRVSAMLPNRGHAALLRSAVLAFAVAAAVLSVSAQACGVLTPEGEARRDRQEARYLRKETDLKVRGTFGDRQDFIDNEEQRSFTTGIVTAADGRRFRLMIPQVINCGFPRLWLSDDDVGLFYLKRDDHPLITDEEDLADGVIDNYELIHFRSGRGK